MDSRTLRDNGPTLAGVTSDGVASMLRFAVPERGDWESQVERALRGEPFESLVGRTDDGIGIRPLYTASDYPTSGDPAGLPGAAPFTRGPHQVPRRWDLRQRHDLDDPAAVGTAIRADAAGGTSSIWLRLRRAPAPGELLAALGGVNLAETPVVLDAGPWYAAAAAATEALAAAVPAGGLVVGTDPLGALARYGFLLDKPSEALRHLAPLVAATRSRALADTDAEATAGGRAVTVDVTAYADAGAPPALELACLLATGVAYLRALDAGGIEPQVAAQHVEARLVATADQFATIVKLRAARTVWDHVLAACGVAASRRTALRCWAVTSEAMAVAQDPFVNLVRATTAGFAAAAGGAECLTVLPHDTALGPPGERGRRLARNISHLLADEARLGAVADPPGGSWYVEERTGQLAAAAWERFREIESAGGMTAGLLDGSLAAAAEAAWQRRRGRLASGAEHVVGVTCFVPPGADAGAGAPDASTGAASAAVEIPVDAAVCIPPLPLRRPGPEELL